MKATIAVLGFILSSAAKHNVDSESLSSELQQLGLPKGRGDPWGVTMGWTCWRVLGLSWEPPALASSCPVQSDSHVVPGHLPCIPPIPGDSSGSVTGFW